MLTAWDQLAVFAAGTAAGMMNTVVGSGTLITFPVLLAFGYPPVTANMSNTVGLVPGSVSGAVGYRSELRGQGGRLVRLSAASMVGGFAGGVLLLVLPAGAFSAIVPALVGLACVLVVVQPRLSRLLARPRDVPPHGSVFLIAGVLLTGIYGGYFGAAQGVLLIALLGLFLDDGLQRLNGAKNVLAGVVNLLAALLFIAVGHIAWLPALLIAVGSIIGGQIGARVGRRLPPAALRAVMVTVGVVAIAKMVTS